MVFSRLRRRGESRRDFRHCERLGFQFERKKNVEFTEE